MKKLLLEGGAQRSLFTAGVLDYFLEKDLNFDQAYGISAGALTAVSYKSKDKGRNLVQMEKFADDHRYISFANWLKTQSVFGWDFLFNEIPDKYLPINKEEFKKNPLELFAGAYNAQDGTMKYFEVTDYDDSKSKLYLQATSSLPIFTKLCMIDGIPYADGGVGDSFALSQFKDDQAKYVMVLTRDITYRKDEAKEPGYLRVLYANYPHLVQDYLKRAITYNDELMRIEHLEKTGQMFVIRPSKPVTVSRVEKDKVKLKDLYDDGYKTAEKLYPRLIAYLTK